MPSKQAGVRRSPKVAHLTSVHAADDVRIYHKECRSLAIAGYSVYTVAPRSRGPLEDVKWIPVEAAEGRGRRMVGTVLGVFLAARALRADLYHIHDPELIPIGLALRLLGSHVIYDVHEDLPKAIRTKKYLPAVLRPIVSRMAALLEAVSGRFFSGIIPATPSIERRFPSARTVTVQNFPLDSELREGSRSDYLKRGPVVAYVGGISPLRGAREMVAAVRLVPSSLRPELVLVGPVPDPALEQELRAADCVRMMGFLDRQEVSQVLASARIGFVLFHPAPNHIDAQPNKLFEYMSSGIPVIASNFPLWREIVEGVGCGLTVDPLDPAAIAKAVERLLSDPDEAYAMGQRGVKAVKERYSWTNEAKKLVGLYDRLLKVEDHPRH